MSDKLKKLKTLGYTAPAILPMAYFAGKALKKAKQDKGAQEKKANLNKLLTKLAKPVNPKVLQAGGVGLTALSLLGLGKAEKKRKALQKIHSEQSNKYVEPTDRKLDELYDRTMAEMDKGRHLGDYKGKPVDQYTRDAIFFNDHDKEFSAERDRLQTKLYEDRMNFQNRATSKEHFNRVDRLRRLENLARVGAALGTVGAGYGMYRDLFKKGVK